jgi:hypothetical protein
MEQVEELTKGKIRKAIIDKDFKAERGIPRLDIIMPKNFKRKDSYLKKKRVERCWSRTGLK